MMKMSLSNGWLQRDNGPATFSGCCIQMQEVAGERGGYLHGRGALDSDDLLYLKEQMEAEEDAERLLRRTEKRAFAAFKKAATQADSSPASVPLPLRVEPKPKSGIRQQDLLKKVVEVKPKRPKVSTPSSPSLSPPVRSDRGPTDAKVQGDRQKEEAKTVLKKPVRPDEQPGTDRNDSNATEINGQGQNALKGLLGLAYESSDEEE
ncbi:hypothetical protein CARUB_v10020934mg [Capsella rubella]|uniref:Uncharacterized protein n=1 Tax=Capsella rubella TaxID=81985 RepID=R0GII7_9BRAS|nr:uncharacterized protein LOC17896241 isoform X3 [Capsella rubella]EOA35707.1 hypothetical protein CARUB_v10020934mg [Capsella rubella]